MINVMHERLDGTWKVVEVNFDSSFKPIEHARNMVRIMKTTIHGKRISFP